MVNSPLVHIIEVPAGMQRAEIRPEVAFLVPVFWIFTEGEDANVRCAHEVDANGLEAVIWKGMLIRWNIQWHVATKSGD